MLQTGQVFAGYVIKRVLGYGGMGTVYLAKHPRLPRLTALKLLKRELYSEVEIRRRFEREADLVAQLDHPNIVTVYDRGTEDQQLWISMQYVPGADASCADVNVLEPGRAVQIISDTAIALDFAHANEVLHRDVKPANILLAKAPIGQPERVLLTDFGIAGVRGSDSTLSSKGSITATLAFGAPEQLMGQPLDDRADQYSLACTLFWLLTGAAPFPGVNPAAVVNSHLFAPVPMLSRQRPGLPPTLDCVLARAMAKSPADRFADCAEFAAAARHALAVGRPRYQAGAPHGFPHNARPTPVPPTRTFPPDRPPHSTTPPERPPHSTFPPDHPHRSTPPADQPPYSAGSSDHPHIPTLPPARPPYSTVPPGHSPLSTPPPDRPPHSTFPPDHPHRSTPPADQPPHSTRSSDHPHAPTVPPDHPSQPTVPPGHSPRSTPPPDRPPHSTPPPDQTAAPGSRVPAAAQNGPDSRETTPPSTTSASPPSGSVPQPRSVPPPTFLPPRRTVRRGTIELPDLPMRPGSAARRQQPPPDARPPPIAVRYRMSLVLPRFRWAAFGSVTTAMVSMFSVVRPVPDRVFLCCAPVRRWVPTGGGKWSRHAGQR
ncbi:protein kinase [Nocardia sp. NPDC060256]|uniref:serine/threonine-protein kinase n=1 Tax=unclassified Nocardia TaxID=2637762 RepID=UPI0036469DD7